MDITGVWKVVSLANSSCGNETGQTLSGLNSDRIRTFLFHRKYQESLKSTNFEHAKTLNSSLWKSKTEVTRKKLWNGKEKVWLGFRYRKWSGKWHIIKPWRVGKCMEAHPKSKLPVSSRGVCQPLHRGPWRQKAKASWETVGLADGWTPRRGPDLNGRE